MALVLLLPNPMLWLFRKSSSRSSQWWQTGEQDSGLFTEHKFLFMAGQYAASAPHVFSLLPLPMSCKVQSLFLGIYCLLVERELKPPNIHSGIQRSLKKSLSQIHHVIPTASQKIPNRYPWDINFKYIQWNTLYFFFMQWNLSLMDPNFLPSQRKKMKKKKTPTM